MKSGASKGYFPFKIQVYFLDNSIKLTFMSFSWISRSLHGASHAYFEKYIDIKLHGFTPNQALRGWICTFEYINFEEGSF